MSCSFPNTHTTQNQSRDSIDSMHDSHNTQGQPIIYLLNCENRKTYQIALQANTDSSGNIMQDKAGNTSYNAILNTELDLDRKATTKLILSCNDLVAQHYSTYDIHKITGVGIVSVNYDLKQKAKKGESIIYKNVLQLKQTTTLDEMITNTDSILEVRINNTQKPLRIDTTLECEALYYGYKLIQWAYMILPTKEYNPHKTKLQKDIDYYELPSDTYKGNIISFNPKEYLQSKDNAPSNQPNSKDNPPNYSQQLQYLTQGDYTLVIFAYQKTPAYKVKNYTTHTKLTYNPPLSLRFNGKELQILEWGEIKRDKLDSNIFDNRNENTAYYRIYSKEYDVIDAQDIPKLFSSYSLTLGIIDTERYYKSNHLKEQDILESMKQDTSLPKGSYYLDIKDIEESLKIRTDYLYTRASGYKALNIYTIDTPNNQYKISYFNNPLDNIPYPKGTTFLTTPNTPIPTYHTDERVKIFLKGSKTYKDFILNLKQKIDNLKTQGYEMERVRLEVGYGTGEMVLEIVRKWEYRGGGNSNADNWATISEFTLLKDGKILKDSNNQDIKGYIVEPAGINPNCVGNNLSPEQQQKTSGSDTRIPAGEYEVFWRYSDSAVSADEGYLKEIGISNFNKKIVLELRAINGTDIGNRGGILIHVGNTGTDSLGCLMPNKNTTQDANKHYNGGSGSTEKTKQLITAIIQHDPQSYINANNKSEFKEKTEDVVVKNFKILIREENIEINPKEK